MRRYERERNGFLWNWNWKSILKKLSVVDWTLIYSLWYFIYYIATLVFQSINTYFIYSGYMIELLLNVNEVCNWNEYDSGGDGVWSVIKETQK
jgi:hypothetical protein